jgi:hypothetical protein
MIPLVRVRFDPEMKAAKKASGPVDPTAYANPNIRALTNQLRAQIAVPGVSGPAVTGSGGGGGKGKGNANPKKSAAAKRGWETRKGTRQSAAQEARDARQAAQDARQARLDAQHDEDRQRGISRQNAQDQRQAALDKQHNEDRAAAAAAKQQTAAQREATAAAQAQAKAQAEKAKQLAAAMRRAAIPPKASTAGAPNVARFNAVGQVIAAGEASDQDWADWAYEGAVAGVVDPKGVLDSLPAGAKAKYQAQLDALRKPDPAVVDQLKDKVQYGLASTNERAEYVAQQIALGKLSPSVLADSGAVGQAAAARLDWLTGRKTLEGKAGGADRNRGGAEKLRRYWTHGPGAAKIGWGSGGDFMRCVAELSKYLGNRAKGYCANRHKEATGEWPGPKAHGGKSLCCSDCGTFKTDVAGLRLDAQWREVKAGALYGGERTHLPAADLHKRALRAWITRRGGPQAEAPGAGQRTGTRSGPTPQRLSQGATTAPGVLPQRQAALHARIAARQDRLFDDMASGKPDPYRPPPPPPMPDLASLAPGSGQRGGRSAPLTTPEWDARTRYYDRIIKTPEWKFGGPHDTSVKNWDQRTQTWTPERAALHMEILQGFIDKASAAGVGHDGHAVILGGMTGAGKSTALHDPAIMAKLGVDVDDQGNPTSHLIVSGDDIKEELVRRGAVDTMPGLTPFESAHLIHEESRLLAEALLRSAISQRMNLIYDGALGNYHIDRKRASWLEQPPAGGDPYSIQGLFMDVSPQTAQESVAARWRNGVDRYEVAGAGDGGRPIPSYVVAQAANVGPKAPMVDGPDGPEKPKTANRGVFQAFIDQGVFDTAVVIDNDGANRGKNVVVQDYTHPDLVDEEDLVSA